MEPPPCQEEPNSEGQPFAELSLGHLSRPAPAADGHRAGPGLPGPRGRQGWLSADGHVLELLAGHVLAEPPDLHAAPPGAVYPADARPDRQSSGERRRRLTRGARPA